MVERASTTKSKRTALRGVGEAEGQSCQGKNHIPAMGVHIWEGCKGTNLFLEEQGIQALNQASQPLGPAQERKAPQILGFENQ